MSHAVLAPIDRVLQRAATGTPAPRNGILVADNGAQSAAPLEQSLARSRGRNYLASKGLVARFKD